MSCVQTQSEVAGKTVLLQIGNQNCGAVGFVESTDLVTLADHSLEDGEIVQFSTITTTTGIVIDTDYYVVNAVAGVSFQVALTAGGTPLVLTNDGTGELEESFANFAGIRSKSFTLNNEMIDITNQDSDQWRKIADQAGIRSMSISGNGVFNDDLAFKRARSRALTGRISNFRLILNNDGDYFQGFFKIATLGGGGEYNAESTYDLTLESSGEIAFTEIP